MIKKFWRVMVALSVVLTLTAGAAYAGAPFYEGKTIRLIVGHSAGGGFDTYSRAIARHIGKYIPGNPTIIVENMPGAGSMIALNHVYNAGPKDGTLIGSFDGGLIAQQLFVAPGVKFDATKLFYLGAPDSFDYIMVVTKRSGITKFEDILGPSGKQVALGATPNTTIEDSSLLIRDVLRGKVKLVSGYKGTADIRLAMASGELDGVITDWGSLRVTNSKEFESGEWVILAQLTEKAIQDLPQKNIPLIYQFAKDDEQRQLFKFGVIDPNMYARPYIVPPGVPADRGRLLEMAFAKTMKDGELLAEARNAKLGIKPISGEQIREMIVEGLGIPARIRDRLKSILKPAS